MTHIGTNIKKLRKVKGLSQQAFAELFNLTRGNISSYEELRAEPKIEIIAKIAKYFSIPLNHLIEKNLSVNEILNFNDYFEEITPLVSQRGFKHIPFFDRQALSMENNGLDQLANRPLLVLPLYSQNDFIAVEYYSTIPQPNSLKISEGSVLFFERITTTNCHTLEKTYGLYFSKEAIFLGEFVTNDSTISLELSPWKKEDLPKEDFTCFWKLHSRFVAEF